MFYIIIQSKKINEGGKYGFCFILAKTVLKSIIIDTFEAFLCLNYLLLADINECLKSPCYVNNSRCENTRGGYNCSCTNGYILGANNVCKGNYILLI